MSSALDRLKERQVAFALAPSAKTGVLEAFFAIPDGAWDAMRHFRSSEFNLPNVGIPLMVAMTRCRDRAEGLQLLRARGLRGVPNPKAQENWILLATGRTAAGALLVLLLIPEAAKRDLMAAVKHQFDLRDRGAQLIIQIIARHSHADCIAALQGVIADEPMRDVSDQDLSFDQDPGARQ